MLVRPLQDFCAPPGNRLPVGLSLPYVLPLVPFRRHLFEFYSREYYRREEEYVVEQRISPNNIIANGVHCFGCLLERAASGFLSIRTVFI